MANAQLELACQVGSREAIIEAIEEGADINFGGSSPLIVAILAQDRPTVETLIELGADVSCFELGPCAPEALVDALLQSGPAAAEVPDKDPVDAKLVRAFDRMIRNKGLAEPFKKGRGAEYPTFCASLKWIAAEDCHAIIEDFLAQIEQRVAEGGDLGVDTFLADREAEVLEWGNRYVAAPDLPGDLLKEYLKERKKLVS